MITPKLMNRPRSRSQSPDRHGITYSTASTRKKDAGSSANRSNKASPTSRQQSAVKEPTVHKPPSSLAVPKSRSQVSTPRCQTPNRRAPSPATPRSRPPSVTVNILRHASSPQTLLEKFRLEEVSLEPVEKPAQSRQVSSESYRQHVSDQNRPPPDLSILSDGSDKYEFANFSSSPPSKLKFSEEALEKDRIPSSNTIKQATIYKDDSDREYDSDGVDDHGGKHDDEDDGIDGDDEDNVVGNGKTEEAEDEEEDDDWWKQSPLLNPKTGTLDWSKESCSTIPEEDEGVNPEDNEAKLEEKENLDDGKEEDEEDDWWKQSPILNPKTGTLNWRKDSCPTIAEEEEGVKPEDDVTSLEDGGAKLEDDEANSEEEDSEDDWYKQPPFLNPKTGTLDWSRDACSTTDEEREKPGDNGLNTRNSEDEESEDDWHKRRPFLNPKSGTLDWSRDACSTTDEDEGTNLEDDRGGPEDEEETPDNEDNSDWEEEKTAEGRDIDENFETENSGEDEVDEDDDILKQNPLSDSRTGKVDNGRNLDRIWDDHRASKLLRSDSSSGSESAEKSVGDRSSTYEWLEESPSVLEPLIPKAVEDSVTTDEAEQLGKINSQPRFIHCFNNISAADIYKKLNFNFQSFYNPIIEAADVFLPRTVYFDNIALESQDTIFSAPTVGKPYMMSQCWVNCNNYDAHIIRDLHCSYNITLHKLLGKVQAFKPIGWTDVWVEPCQFVSDLITNLECTDEDVEHIWSDYGIDLFRFVETQNVLRCAPYSFKPGAIQIHAPAASDQVEGRNMYLLTCSLLSSGMFMTRQYPPQVMATPSLSMGSDGVYRCTIMPDIWHPHLSPSRAMTFPGYTVTGDTPWLEWDPEENCFKGDIPLADTVSQSNDGRIAVTITGEYNLNIGSSKIGLHESITARLYLPLPAKEEVASDNSDIANEGHGFPTLAASLLTSSPWLGFDNTHSAYIASVARMYDRTMQNIANEMSMNRNQRPNLNVRPWDTPPRSKTPRLCIKSLGPTPWYTFLTERQQEEYYRVHDREGRKKFIESLEEDHRQEPVAWSPIESEAEEAEVKVDKDLEEMRRMYETQFNEAHVILWLNTTYRESMQDRLLEESYDDFPPLGVLILAGCGPDFLINICLTILGYFPGHIHAFYLMYVFYERREAALAGILPTEDAPGVYSDRINSGGVKGYETLYSQRDEA
ncbi:hypothetical protein Dda_8495 [Drechslerella dactyloides]|uniref:Uncharacterized protein n=1 Tax=Drechslerella dactyloides TaxID=74499 RepID=A0AAD6NFQ4_DREDA|nr:hypothetical protein Dda_8495 [Drechslerella dactyloides]